MPAITLVVCLYQQRELLARLIARSAGCYDDLVVVHDGPDKQDIRAMVEAAGGRFFARPHERQQEPHWPFAWEQARHDWILRLDADEYPSEGLKEWLQTFRQAGEPSVGISGYNCIWPIWRKDRAVTKNWPDDRNFLFDRRQVRFFGMVEQIPIPDGHYESLKLILHHELINRKSHGLRNLIWRKQAYLWRHCIAKSLLGQPTELAGWRWTDPAWPAGWEQIRRQPIRTAIKRLLIWPWLGMQAQWRAERKLLPLVALGGPLHHILICLEYLRLKQGTKKSSAGKNRSGKQ